MGLLLTLAQLLGLLAALAGVAMWSLPAALVLGGLAVVALCELAERRRAAAPDRPGTDTGQSS